MPLGNVPILEVNETTIPLVQSLAIARYAAKEAGEYRTWYQSHLRPKLKAMFTYLSLTDLAGRTSLEMAMADAVVDTALELFLAFTEKIYPLYKFPVATDRVSIMSGSENPSLWFGHNDKIPAIFRTGILQFKISWTETWLELLITLKDWWACTASTATLLATKWDRPLPSQTFHP